MTGMPPLPTGLMSARLSDPDVFTRIRGRAANVIAKYGEDVWFFDSEGEPAYENPDGSWTEATDPFSFDAKGIQTRGDPDELMLASLGTYNLKNPVTVLVAAEIERVPGTFEAIAGAPTPGMQMQWAEILYNVIRVLPVAPNGNPIYFVVVGDT